MTDCTPEWRKRVFEAENPVLIRRSKDPFGWMGNMSQYPVKHEGVVYRTSEHLFQCLRVDEGAVRELIREEGNPFKAKLIAKKYAHQRTIECLTSADLDLMRLTLAAKLESHPAFCNRLVDTDGRLLIEDCTTRQGGSGLYWGAALLQGGTWGGMNWLGELWMELRSSLVQSRSDPTVEDFFEL